MIDDFSALRDAFRQESAELLAALEEHLLELDRNPDDLEAVSAVFRAFHTIKGSSGICGFPEVSAFTHHVENLYEQIRSGALKADGKVIDLTLSARDLIADMIASPESGWDETNPRVAGMLERLRSLLPAKASAAGKKAARREAAPARKSGARRTYRIRFHPATTIFFSGSNPLALISELRSMGECTVVAHTDDIPPLAEFDPEYCRTSWDIVLTTEKTEDDIRDVFIFMEGECLVKIDVIDDGSEVLDAQGRLRLGEILVERQDISSEDLERVLRDRKLMGQVLVEEGLVSADKVQSALAEQEHMQQVRERRAREEAISTLRVPADKLDSLVNLVGELVTVQARLSQAAGLRNDADLVLIAEEVERLTADLRDNTMEIRLLPIGTIFARFKRLVRDLSRDLGKEVELTTAGGDTELDKSVIDKLYDALVHLIRNSIDHGIEGPAEREAAGKPRKGRIHLAAAHVGTKVMITVWDDGAGLNPEAIRGKAVERGLLAAEAAPSEDELFNLIFAAGFSTATSVTNVSGRGVGLDVVRRAVDKLRGDIAVASERGAGTTITLGLPLTLAIIEGLLVKIGASYFILPLNDVEECVELTRQQRMATAGRHIANVRDEVVPYVRLREHFLLGDDAPEREQIVIVRTDKHRTGLVVDHVVGEHQTVIKPLGRVYRDIEGLSGATILGDGTLALIVDVAALIKTVARDEAGETA